jgi:hypothetical protein
VGPAFSAASRDPEHHRFADIEDYFRRAHEGEMPAVLCARAVVRDVRSGRRVRLWESDKGHRWGVARIPPDHVMAPFMPQDSLLVGTNAAAARPIVYPPCCAGAETVRMGVKFGLRPEAGQEGVPARDKLWRLAGGDTEHYGEHSSFLNTFFKTGDPEAVGKFVWSLLYTP